MPSPRIDVHSHFLPSFYRSALQSHGYAKPDGMPSVPEWDIDSHLALMDRLSIQKSIISISSPGTTLSLALPPTSPASPAALTRQCNAHAASLKQQHPTRIGFWASLPMLDIPAALEEISTATAANADGFALLTNYAGHYLGDSLFAPIFAALNDRAATLFIHPTTPCCAGSGLPPPTGGVGSATPLAPAYPNPVLEFFFDTARAATNLFLSGAVQRYPELRFVLPHCGGALPPLLNRFVGFSSLVSMPDQNPELDQGQDQNKEKGEQQNQEQDQHPIDPSWLRETLNTRFWFDMAGIVFLDGGGDQLSGLIHGCGIHKLRLLYGSDTPFTPAAAVEKMAVELDAGLGRMFEEDCAEEVLFGNAVRLLEGIEGRKGKGMVRGCE